MDIAMKLFRDCFRCVAIREKFCFCLRRNSTWDWPDALKIDISDGVRNKNRADAGEVESLEIGRNIRSCRRRQRRFGPRPGVGGGRLEGENVVIAVSPARG